MLVISPGKKYAIEDVLAVVSGEEVSISNETITLIDDGWKKVEKYVTEKKTPSYGYNRGFGHLVDVPVPENMLAELQRNLIKSHASCVGEFAPREVVRALIFLRLVSLSQGYSGIRGVIVTTLADMLNKWITPCIPMFGSVGASGDLAPLSHMALVMMGLGEATIGNGPEPPFYTSEDLNDERQVFIQDALAQVGLSVIELNMKEGLALNNGTQFSTALGILSYVRMKGLLKSAALATALSSQVMLGSDKPFRKDVHLLRPHTGSRIVAEWIWDMVQGSGILNAHRDMDIDGEVQDPYNIRCAAQVLGACYDLIEEARVTFEIELNSVTDNPLVFPDYPDPIVSGGHFHGMPIAIKIYNLIQAMGIMARLSNMRCARYVDGKRNKGLPDDLKWPNPAKNPVSSGMMIPEYVSAALTNAIWGAAMPTHLMSISTDAGQEDHVSMSAGLGVRLWETLPRLAEVLAIELAFAAQAAELRKHADFIPSKIALTKQQQIAIGQPKDAYLDAVKEQLNMDEKSIFDVDINVSVKHPLTTDERKLSPVCEKVLKAIYQVFPVVTEDRFMSPQLKKLAERVTDGTFVAIVEKDIALTDRTPNQQ